MARLYADDGFSRYGNLGEDFGVEQDLQDLITRDVPERPLDQVSPDQITADQNNYRIPSSNLIRFDTDAARTITGFAGARPGIFMIAYTGANSLVLPNENAGSDPENQMLTHTGLTITLTASNRFAMMQYDFESARWLIGELA